MADNTHIYGIRYLKGYGTAACPQPVEKVIASHYQPVDGSAANVNLHYGDPLKQVAAGVVELSQAGELCDFLFLGMKQMLLSDGVRPYERYIGATAYGASSGDVVPVNKSSIAICLPILPGMVFEADADDQSVTTYSAFVALIGVNMDHVFSRDATNAADPKANPLLDIGTAGTSDGQWRYLGLSKTAANRDLTGAYTKHLIQVNESKQVPIGAGAGI